jgi:hypothetical protein
MSLRDKIDGVLIDPDENGFHLILSGEDREYNFTLDASAAQQLVTAVAVEISPWIQEMRKNNEEYASSRHGPVGASGGYEPTDPKSEGFHDRMSEVWDSREGK